MSDFELVLTLDTHDAGHFGSCVCHAAREDASRRAVDMEAQRVKITAARAHLARLEESDLDYLFIFESGAMGALAMDELDRRGEKAKEQGSNTTLNGNRGAGYALAGRRARR